MLRQLGQPLERDPHQTHPRKGDIDPEDTVFVVYIYPEEGALDQTTPQLVSIWLSEPEARAAAERYALEGHPHFTSGRASSITVVEYETGKMHPRAERHHQVSPPPPPVVVSPDDDPQKRLEQLEIEAAAIRIKLGIGTQTTLASPESR